MLMRLRGEYGLAMGLFDRANRWLRASPWRLLCVVCVTGFLAGGLLDLDHLPAAIAGFAGFHGFHSGRILHGFALFWGGIMCACAGGYFFCYILKDAYVKLKNKVLNKLASKTTIE
jgi:hypothetical protein